MYMHYPILKSRIWYEYIVYSASLYGPSLVVYVRTHVHSAESEEWIPEYGGETG